MGKAVRNSKTTCCVLGCHNAYYNTDDSVKFYKFPRRWYLKEQKQMWINSVRSANMNSRWTPKDHHAICSAHFIGNSKSNNPSSPAFNPRIFPNNLETPWTQQQTSILLEEFKKYPNLYNKSHKDFQNSQLKSACINQIIQKLLPFRPGVTEPDVLCKFSSLNAVFQEVRRELEAFQGGIKEIEEQRWWCFKQMQFLVRPIPDQSYVEDEPQFVVVKDEPIADLRNSEWENCISESKDPLSMSMETIVVKEESENLETPYTSQTSNEVNKNSDSPKDENDIFGEFVASQLKKITDESLRQDTIFEIHKILHKAVRNYN